MPLVRIDALPTHDDATLAALGDAVHQALTETLGFPDDDLFQVISSAGQVRYSTYPGIPRDDGVVFTMRAGRTYAEKKALYAAIAELAAERAGIEPRNVLITVTENQPVDWSFGEGVAQYLE
ncbi:tautomerase family protein [Amycolatopsis viridis]|uniref:Phenylpyruvate tautomerase PptA (4-oxalocrotonate tautomerase family) n=1 Tax=Amycolatopsis viridis TaxID=185678 RepID=A0ABX0SW43_9PSEU|nr:tautomerase family protein [Amycolatopsis viridis]NIH79580.1 phenylpyruvate tautomerase PptA (4-oxalocrotonate tautomerase family) [Amycolatopsis viridis]